MSINIVVNLQVEGIHRREKCPFREASFLKSYHRHIFYIKCIREVSHNDRDIEIIIFKRKIQSYLQETYRSTHEGCLWFDGMSCEMIAKELIDEFNLYSCEVLEDGENGALLIK